MLQINDAAGQIDFYTTYKCQIGNNASMTCTSDSRKKNIIGTATDNLAKIMQIQPTYYTMKNDTSNRLQLGLIAQNVQTQFPTAVVTGDDGYLQLDYGSLVSPLIGAVQEQQAQIDSLKTSVTSLQASNGLVDGGTINGNITINGSLTVSGDITVTQNASFQQNVAIAGELHTADIYVGGHIVTVGVAPLATLGGGVGSVDTLHSVNAPQVTIDGNDTSGTVTITTGANATADKLFDLLFNKPFSAKPRVIFSPANQKSSQLGAYYDVNSVTKDGFSLYAGSTPEAATSYAFTYYVVQ